MKLNTEFYRQIFESEPMAKHLAGLSLEPERIAEAVILSPISLKKKQRILEDLTREPGGDQFNDYLIALNEAVSEAKMKPGEILLLYERYAYDYEYPDLLAPCTGWDDLFSKVKSFTQDLRAEFKIDKPLVSYRAEKWSPVNGKFKKRIEYIIIDGEVCGFLNESWDFLKSHRDFPDFGYDDLNIPAPFKPGDIVSIDCAPFAPVERVAILDCGDNPYECCLPCALYYDGEDKVWKAGAVKHKHIFPKEFRSPLSPLYRIDYAPEPLLCENDAIGETLPIVSKYIDGSEEKARELFDFIFNLECGGDKRFSKGIPTEQLKNFLTERV